MEKRIIINVSLGETRIAILEDSVLTELYFEQPDSERMVGDIYFARAEKIVRGIHAAFIDIGKKQDGFLHFSDIGNQILTLDPESPKNNPKIINVKKPGEVPVVKKMPILTQVTKEPISNKGARVTTEITLPGRFLVLLPNEEMVGVSRKIRNRREKYRLKKVGRQIKPKGFGIVIRTVAQGKSDEILKADLDNLVKQWQAIQKKVAKAVPPTLVFKDVDTLSSVVRDLFTPDITELVVDNKQMHKQIHRYIKDVAPNLVDSIQLYQKKNPIFDEYGVESQITKSLSRKVWLKRGGYIFIEHTEALTAIDVNSGRFSGKDNRDANSLKVNLDAAREIARQIRLRDIGGIVILDFIDMTEAKNRKKLEDEFTKELKKDRAQVNITKLSEFGIIEMTRERIRPNILHSISEPCPACLGTGRVLSKATLAARIERWIKRYRTETKERSVQLIVNPQLAKALTKGYRNPLRKMGWKYWVKIKLVIDDNLAIEDFRFLDKSGEEDVTLKYMS